MLCGYCLLHTLREILLKSFSFSLTVKLTVWSDANRFHSSTSVKVLTFGSLSEARNVFRTESNKV